MITGLLIFISLMLLWITRVLWVISSNQARIADADRRQRTEIYQLIKKVTRAIDIHQGKVI